MLNTRNLNNKLKVCSEPGCRAWNSEKILTLVRESAFEKQNIKLCSVSCVNNCGGVSVGIPASKKFVKLREPNEVFVLLNQVNSNG